MIETDRGEEGLRLQRKGEDPQPSPRPERVCPNCGAALYESRCKLLCPSRACGYFMSCSDFY
jgi:hypothetical protein